MTAQPGRAAVPSRVAPARATPIGSHENAEASPPGPETAAAGNGVPAFPERLDRKLLPPGDRVEAGVSPGACGLVPSGSGTFVPADRAAGELASSGVSLKGEARARGGVEAERPSPGGPPMPGPALSAPSDAGAPGQPAGGPSDLEALRRLCLGAGRSVASPAEPHPLGTPLDAALGGGLARGVLHEAFCADAGGLGAALGFVAVLAAGVRGPVVWVRQDMAVHEAGRLYGAGCAELGIDPDRLLLVEAPDAAGVLRATEEALRHPAPALVIAEPWGTPRVLDLTATRRLALRAGERGALAVLLRPGGEPAPSVAATRWLVGPASSSSAVPHGLGPPAFALELVRNRLGPTGCWTMEWDGDARRFKTRPPVATPLPAPHGRLPAAPVHRPAASERGEGALRRA